MKTVCLKLRGEKASVLLAVIFATVILSIVIASALQFSLFNYRSSLRKIRYQQVKIAAANEMEYMFYRWALIATVPSAASPEAQLASTTPKVVHQTADSIADSAESTWKLANDAFLSDGLSLYPTISSTITLGRSLKRLNINALGPLANENAGIEQTSTVKYWMARTRVKMDDPVLGAIEVRIGRRFTLQMASSCARAVYYQGDMEFGANGQLDIRGEIECNNDIYLGAQNNTTPPSALNLYGKVFYYGKFNGADDINGTRYTFDQSKNGYFMSADYRAAGGKASQVQHMNGRDNLLGFNNPDDPSTSVSAIAAAYPAAYPNGENDVLRALVAPSPTDASGNAIPEDDRVAGTRLYNQAGIRITIDNGTVTFQDPHNPSLDLSSLSSAVTETRKNVYDAREMKNVAMTTIDVAALATAIKAIESDPSNSWKFNGVLYVYDKTAESSTLVNGIRLSNGTKTPGFDYSAADASANANTTGFTVASDNGVYLQGSYNTATDPVTGATNRAAVLADAVTLLSDQWDDSKAYVAGAPTNPEDRVVSSNIEIDAAIMTGNVASKWNADGTGYATTNINGTDFSVQSGGTQNLVRLLENWNKNKLTTTIKGSLVQLFNSTHFNSPYRQPDYKSSSTSKYAYYMAPALRSIIYDSTLASNPPNGVPNSEVRYYRGDLYTW